MSPRYSIAEWYGQPFLELSLAARRRLAKSALQEDTETPPCPYQSGRPPCRKRGGVCSIQRYEGNAGGRLGIPNGDPAIVCPARFEDKQLLLRWLAEIVGFSPNEAMVACEVPFMRGTGTDRPAGKIDLVVAKTTNGNLNWYGLEIQAVYFSGPGMRSEFSILRDDDHQQPPYPGSVRRPDWRSSSAKRLMPQLQIKVPTLRRWGSKIAVAVDRPFFESIGGPSAAPSRDLNDGDIIWLVPELRRNEDGYFELSRGHWEVLTLEDTSNKLLAAKTIRREVFERELLNKLERLE